MLLTSLIFALSFLASLSIDLPENFQESEIISDLSDPDGMAFSPDGRLFISERITGRLLVAKYDSGSDSWSLNPDPFFTFDIPKSANGQPKRLRSAGLRDIAFDPDFASNGFIYAFYMKDDVLQNRVVRIKASTANPDIADLGFGSGGEELLLDLPFNTSQSSGSHNGGGVEFGGDNKLYISTGDGWEGTFAGDPVQSLTTFTGKILRINSDGSIGLSMPWGFEILIPCLGTTITDYSISMRQGEIVRTESIWLKREPITNTKELE